MNTTLQKTICFIKSYRSMEKGTLANAKAIISQLTMVKFANDHLYGAWKGKKSNFGDWFLNLSKISQYDIICFFGLGLDEADIDLHIAKIEEFPMAEHIMDSLPIVFHYQEVLKFFNNHRIIEEPTEGIILTNIPAPNKQQGNSTNWADYIMSLEPDLQEIVLSAIVNRIQVGINELISRLYSLRPTHNRSKQIKQCPNCETLMSMGVSHSGAGCQWECFTCGKVIAQDIFVNGNALHGLKW